MIFLLLGKSLVSICHHYKQCSHKHLYVQLFITVSHYFHFHKWSSWLQVVNILKSVNMYCQEFYFKKKHIFHEAMFICSPLFPHWLVSLKGFNKTFVQWINIWHQPMKIKEVSENNTYFSASLMHQRYFTVVENQIR